MSGVYDVFFSYRRSDLARAQPLLSALDESGMRVWRDQTDLPDNSAITAEIRQGMAVSKVLIAFYSTDYPLSRPCQQEITAGWIAAQQMGEQPYRRLLVLNPEDSFDHLPSVLREQQSMRWANDSAGLAVLVAKVRSHVNILEGPLIGAASPARPAYFGMAPLESPKFVGRVREMWDLHGRLTANRISIITGVVGQAAAQIRGLGGSGKSLLAREYTIRFGSAYPGGVFWLSAYGNDDTKGTLDADAREALRQTQIRDFAVNVGIHVEGLTLGEVEGAFWRRLAQNGQPCLWVVDDLPSELEQQDIEKRWNGQWSGVSTLITSRSTEYAIGGHLDLEVLSEVEASQLLTSHCNPQGQEEIEAARLITRELGCHPLAIEVAGSYLAKGVQNFCEYLKELRNPQLDAVEFGSDLRENLPTGHGRSIKNTLLKSIRLLGEEGLNFLCLASALAVAPIPVKLLQATLELIESNTPPLMRLLRALDEADSLGLCTKAGDDARSVHTLVSRTVRYHMNNEHERRAWLRTAAARALSKRLEIVTDARTHSQIAVEMTHARQILVAGISTIEEAAVGMCVAIHDCERGDFAGGQKLFEQVLEARRRLLGEEHPDTLTTWYHLAEAIREQGGWARAGELFDQVLKVRRRVLGDKNPDTLTVMAALAGTIHDQGDPVEAQRLLEQVFQTRRQILGEGHLDTLLAQNYIAELLAEQGSLEAAKQLQENVLEGVRRLLGDDYPRTLGVKFSLAKTLIMRGEYDEAQKLLEQILDTGHRLSFDEHPDILDVRNSLAGILAGRGDLDGARQLLQQVLEAMRRRLGDEHPNTVTVEGSLAAIISLQSG